MVTYGPYGSKMDPKIVPNFISNSTGKYIEELGFKNIIKLDFNIQYNFTNNTNNINSDEDLQFNRILFVFNIDF